MHSEGAITNQIEATEGNCCPKSLKRIAEMSCDAITRQARTTITSDNWPSISIGGITYNISYLRSLFPMPMPDAAKSLGISISVLKHICCQLKIEKWPYRQIRAIRNNIQMLETTKESTQPNDDSIVHLNNKIETLKNRLDQLIMNPNSISYKTSKRRTCNDDESSIHNNSKRNEDMISSSSACTTDRYRSRKDSTYNLKTGWIADCHACGREGKYRPPSEGRPFQHSTGMGKYCGYFRVNPRRASEPSPQGKKRPSSSEELSRIKKLQQDVILQYHQKLSSQEIDHTTLKLSSSLDNALSWAKHRVSSSSMGQGASISDLCPQHSTSSTTTMTTVNDGHTSSVSPDENSVRKLTYHGNYISS